MNNQNLNALFMNSDQLTMIFKPTIQPTTQNFCFAKLEFATLKDHRFLSSS